MSKRGISTAATFICVIAMVGTAWGSTASPASASNPRVDAKTATSAKAFGGLAGLIKAAKAEGTLNVIALPPDWANYGAIISSFQKKYGIKINSAQPDADSQTEIDAAVRLKGHDTAPDVFDLGTNVALGNTNLFAPYKVLIWKDIPATVKDKSGKWYGDYGGYSSIGYNPDAVPAPKTVSDLLKPAYRGKVALNGDPTRASAGFHGLMMVNIAMGGTATNLAPGVAFFHKLYTSGNFLKVDPTPATVQSGATPVVIDWEYLNAGYSKEFAGKIKWNTIVPRNDVVGAFYDQAINKDAPHPAAARLWEEYLYSNAGQILWLKGLARPVRLAAMIKAHAVSSSLVAALPKVTGKPLVLTPAQITADQAYLTQNWSSAIGG
ncbi:MAG: extracellular solute-binding protein [Chloroflexi bacterium]|nr:extracellular solute-binding protein [Chloroflexota bacterium]